MKYERHKVKGEVNGQRSALASMSPTQAPRTLLRPMICRFALTHTFSLSLWIIDQQSPQNPEHKTQTLTRDRTEHYALPTWDRPYLPPPCTRLHHLPSHHHPPASGPPLSGLLPSRFPSDRFCVRSRLCCLPGRSITLPVGSFGGSMRLRGRHVRLGLWAKWRARQGTPQVGR